MKKPKNEDLIRLRDVPALIHSLTGATRTRATVYEWARNGRIGYDASKLKLKTVRRMGQIFTTKEWVIEFIGKVA